MNIRSIAIVSILLLLSVLSVGCMKLERPQLDRKYYVIGASRDSQPRERGSETLVVRRVQVSPRYQDRELVYRTGETTYEADYYNSFFIPPAEMITDDLRRWLGESGMFENVIAPQSLASGGLILEGMINSLYGDFSSSEPEAVVEMQFFLVDNRDAETPSLYSRGFSERVKLGSRSSDALVKAMNKAVAVIFKKLEEDLSALKTVRGQEAESIQSSPK